MRSHFILPSAAVSVTVLASALILAMGSCAPTPSHSATGRLVMPKRYDATPPPVMELRSGLLTLFPSKVLRSYVDDALAHNLDLQASAAELEEAGFDVTRVGAPSRPSLTAAAATSRVQAPSLNSRSLATRFSPSLDARWELDVWGRIKAGVTAASRDFDAAEADYTAARDSIAAQTIQSYFNLLAADKLVSLAKRRQESFQNSYDLVNRRFEAGTGGLADTHLARTDLESSKAQVADRVDTRDRAARALAVLTGSYPDTSASSRSSSQSWPSLKGGVKAGIPSDLLMNRPDVDAAFQRILAADSRVKVAHRDLYPSFNLTASGGRDSSTLRDLANSNFNVWSILAGVSAPLLDGGGRRAELGAANARAKRALLDYQSIVLEALREVEDALGSERQLLLQQSATRSALEASRSAEKGTKRDYESGLVEILTLLDTQRRSFTTEEALINTTLERYNNRVSLALALGKGL